jgi:NAD-dependent deacetylase
VGTSRHAELPATLQPTRQTAFREVAHFEDQVANVRAWVRSASRIVALTGAGISTDSGIPDFRGPEGVWTRNPRAQQAATLERYLRDPSVRHQAWRSRLESPAWRAEPNAGHRALVELEGQGKLDTLITQNIDELHQRAGSDPARVVELHGTMFWVVCWSCGARQPTEEVLRRVRAGEEDPACTASTGSGERCGGILKSATVSFGQDLAPGDAERACCSRSAPA